jgi:hypothetical protein
VVKTLRSQAGASATPHTSIGVIGSSPRTSSASPGSSPMSNVPPPPPPPPSDNLLRNHQVHPRSHTPDAAVLQIDHVEHRNHWLPKMNFSMFDGSDARIWVDKCIAYFTMYQIPPGFHVSAASIHMTDVVAHWFQSYNHTTGFQIWEQFVQAMIAEFEVDTHRAETIELLNLKQTGLVEEYCKAFEQLVYHIRLFDTSLSSTMLTAQFLMGLEPDIRSTMALQLPDSVAKAAILSFVQKQLLRKQKKSTAKFAYGKQSATSDKGKGKSSISAIELWKARQLKEFRRANGLCYKCGDKFTPGHKCTVTPPAQVAAVQAVDSGDGGGIIDDEILDALEGMGHYPEADSHISLYAFSGASSTTTIHLRALIGKQVFFILMDSGSSHTFINSAMLPRIHDRVEEANPLRVKVANGQVIISNAVVYGNKWWIHGVTFSTDARVLELGAYDMILGMDWLERHNPMNCDWVHKTLGFRHNGKYITLQGVKPVETELCKEISGEQLQKLQKGNDVWAMVVVSLVSTSDTHVVLYMEQGIPSPIQEVILEFDDLFQTPTELPPSRVFDHTISLFLDSVPVNCRPYRYAPQQKDEIERHVSKMLQSGLVVPSTSPFASPVLLVKKKDGTWMFCVDYRKLNAATIKNKFPMPIIDEFLDEIAGVKYFTKLDLNSGFHQIRMAPQDEYKTSFETHHGHFHFRVIPFGFTNAPVTFQWVMNNVFAPFMRKFVLVFMDDILIYSRSLDDHAKHLRQVFQVLLANKMFIKFSKCAFAQAQIEYLGHVISHNGVAIDPDKTVAMVQWPVPSSFTEVRAFLGLTRYYRKFIRSYGIIAKPLTSLLKQKVFAWSKEADECPSAHSA